MAATASPWRCSPTRRSTTASSSVSPTGSWESSSYFDRHPEGTAWKPAWDPYLGRYRLSVYAEPLWYAKLLLAIGQPRAAHIRVRRQVDTMTVDGVQLLEHEPGLFFSKTAEALDFSSDPPTWRTVALTKR